MARRQRRCKQDNTTPNRQTQQQVQSILELDCVLHHPQLLGQSLAVIARLLCTNKATAAAVCHHTSGHLQQLHLQLKSLKQTEGLAAWLCRNAGLTKGLRSLVLQPPQLKTPGIELIEEQLLPEAVQQVSADGANRASRELSCKHSTAQQSAAELCVDCKHLTFDFDD
jgi:hypothetical protein